MRSDGQIALFHTQKGTLIKIMVTLNTIRPSEHRYRLFGTEGSAEMFSYENCTRYFDSACSDKTDGAFCRSADPPSTTLQAATEEPI